MARTKLFVSYSHRDDEWLERLKLHLALLERRGIVHIWSDTRIRVGEQWEAEIESALTESRAAVLMITPAFLASDYIWEKEMPHILRHHLAGMLVFPLITKPCAWRIATELAEFQARPPNGRALSVGSEAAVDTDLADFIYELASLLGHLPSWIASAETDRIRGHDQAAAAYPFHSQSAEGQSFGSAAWLKLGRPWSGSYHPTNRQMRVVIQSVQESRAIQGSIEYTDEGIITEIEGTLLEKAEVDGDPQLAGIVEIGQVIDGAIAFREVREIRSGAKPANLDGKYRAIVIGSRMCGFWISSGIAAQQFEFNCEP
jgi:hypothetical protein